MRILLDYPESAERKTVPLELHLPDDTEFTFDNPREGWWEFRTNELYDGGRRYCINGLYLVAVLPDDPGSAAK